MELLYTDKGSMAFLEFNQKSKSPIIHLKNVEEALYQAVGTNYSLDSNNLSSEEIEKFIPNLNKRSKEDKEAFEEAFRTLLDLMIERNGTKSLTIAGFEKYTYSRIGSQRIKELAEALSEIGDYTKTKADDLKIAEAKNGDIFIRYTVDGEKHQLKEKSDGSSDEITRDFTSEADNLKFLDLKSYFDKSAGTSPSPTQKTNTPNNTNTNTNGTKIPEAIKEEEEKGINPDKKEFKDALKSVKEAQTKFNEAKALFEKQSSDIKTWTDAQKAIKDIQKSLKEAQSLFKEDTPSKGLEKPLKEIQESLKQLSKIEDIEKHSDPQISISKGELKNFATAFGEILNSLTKHNKLLTAFATEKDSDLKDSLSLKLIDSAKKINDQFKLLEKSAKDNNEKLAGIISKAKEEITKAFERTKEPLSKAEKAFQDEGGTSQAELLANHRTRDAVDPKNPNKHYNPKDFDGLVKNGKVDPKVAAEIKKTYGIDLSKASEAAAKKYPGLSRAEYELELANYFMALLYGKPGERSAAEAALSRVTAASLDLKNLGFDSDKIHLGGRNGLNALARSKFLDINNRGRRFAQFEAFFDMKTAHMPDAEKERVRGLGEAWLNGSVVDEIIAMKTLDLDKLANKLAEAIGKLPEDEFPDALLPLTMREGDKASSKVLVGEPQTGNMLVKLAEALSGKLSPIVRKDKTTNYVLKGEDVPEELFTLLKMLVPNEVKDKATAAKLISNKFIKDKKVDDKKDPKKMRADKEQSKASKKMIDIGKIGDFLATKLADTNKEYMKVYFKTNPTGKERSIISRYKELLAFNEKATDKIFISTSERRKAIPIPALKESLYNFISILKEFKETPNDKLPEVGKDNPNLLSHEEKVRRRRAQISSNINGFKRNRYKLAHSMAKEWYPAVAQPLYNRYPNMAQNFQETYANVSQPLYSRHSEYGLKEFTDSWKNNTILPASELYRYNVSSLRHTAQHLRISRYAV